MNVIKNHIMTISKMKYAHQIIYEKLFNQNEISHWEVVALVKTIILNS
jgi:hypothetical protein